MKDTKKKSRCWCCWDSSDKTSDRLVKVCGGCKDPDLQWIHQTCIDRFISMLSSPREESFWLNSQYEVLDSNVTPSEQAALYTRSPLVQKLQTFPGSLEEADLLADVFCSPPDLFYPSGGTNAKSTAPFHKNIMKAILLSGEMGKKVSASQIHTGYYCTRCGDPYAVVEISVRPLNILTGEKLTLCIVTVMNTIAVICTIYVLIIVANLTNNLGISVCNFTSLLTATNIANITSAALFYFIYALCFKAVWNHCKNHTYKHVLPIET